MRASGWNRGARRRGSHLVQEFCRHPRFARIHQVEAVRVRAVAEILARHVEQLSLGALDLDRDRVRPETRLDPLVQVLVERGVDMLLGVRALCRVGAREDELERVAGREVVREGECEGGRQGRDRDGAGLALEQRRFRAFVERVWAAGRGGSVLRQQVLPGRRDKVSFGQERRREGGRDSRHTWVTTASGSSSRSARPPHRRPRRLCCHRSREARVSPLRTASADDLPLRDAVPASRASSSRRRAVSAGLESSDAVLQRGEWHQ